MSDDKSNDGREAGRTTDILESVVDRLERIEKKLDGLTDWQRSVDAKLAAGNEKFRQLESRDRTVGTLASAIGATIGASVAAALAFLKK